MQAQANGLARLLAKNRYTANPFSVSGVAALVVFFDQRPREEWTPAMSAVAQLAVEMHAALMRGGEEEGTILEKLNQRAAVVSPIIAKELGLPVQGVRGATTPSPALVSIPSPLPLNVQPGPPASAAGATPSSGGGVLPYLVSRLTEHPDNRHLFADEVPPAAQEAFERDVLEHGVLHPLVVCGPNCASPPGTILEGHRRFAAAKKAAVAVLPVLVVDGLSYMEELERLIRSNLAAQHTRRLTEAAKFQLEERERELIGQRKGQRPKASVEIHGGPPVRGETNAAIAQRVGEKANAIAERQKVFGSTVSTPELKAAVNAERMKRGKAAKLVRASEKRLAEEGPVALPAILAEQRQQVLAAASVSKRTQGKDSSSPTLALALSDILSRCAEDIKARLARAQSDARAAPQGSTRDDVEAVLRSIETDVSALSALAEEVRRKEASRLPPASPDAVASPQLVPSISAAPVAAPAGPKPSELARRIALYGAAAVGAGAGAGGK